jgi:hypothetical protein
MYLALVEASKTENSTLILGTVNVQGTATGPFPILATDGESAGRCLKAVE